MEFYQEILDDLEKKYYSYFELYQNLDYSEYKLFGNKELYYIVDKLLLPMTYKVLTQIYCHSDWCSEYFIDYYNKEYYDIYSEKDKDFYNFFTQTFSNIIEEEYRKIEFKLYDTIYKIDYMNDYLNYISYEIKRSTYNILYSKYYPKK